MDDEPADVGAVEPELDHAADKVAKDEEFHLFYEQDMTRLVGFLIVQGAAPSLAADIAQDAMIEAYRRWNALDTPRAWVRVVAARSWWKLMPSGLPDVPHEELPEPRGLLDDAHAAEIQERHVFLALLHQLPRVQRQVMAWTYDGYRPTEIAAALGMKPATVRSALRSARTTLRTLYHAGEGTP